VTEKVVLENEPQEIERIVTRVAGKGPVEFVYEAGPCGYEVQRQISAMGYHCAVVAPALTPVRPGDRVKTDRRDAEKLARYYRAGELREIRVPSREEEAARDLPRVREDTLTDLLRAKHRLSKFLLRQGRVYTQTKAWGVKHRSWLKSQRFEWTTLQHDVPPWNWSR
jgi:transposase